MSKVSAMLPSIEIICVIAKMDNKTSKYPVHQIKQPNFETEIFIPFILIDFS